MDLDIQPLDIQPVEDEKLDIQALDIQPLETPKKRAGASSIPGAEEYDVRANKTYENTDTLAQRALGAAEAGAALASGTAAGIAAPFVGTYKALTSPDVVDPNEATKQFAEQYTYQPKTETGGNLTEAVAPLMEGAMAVAPMHFPIHFAPRIAKGLRLAEEAESVAKSKALDEHLVATTPLDIQPISPETMGRPSTEGTTVAVDRNGVAYPPGTDVAQMEAMRQRAEAQQAAAQSTPAGGSPVAAQMNPMERMAATLAPGAERGFPEPEAPNAAIAATADRLSNPQALQESAAADRVLAQRQTELELAVKKQQTLDFNAAERARQENAPSVSPAEQARRVQAADDVQRAQAAVEQARLESESAKAQNMHQAEIDATPHVNPDTNEVIAPQYGAMQGVGRFDENGMPIRADLSMEAQNLQNPLQRGLWGDELGPSQGQRLSMTGALDTLQHSPFKGDARDAALAALGEPRAISNFNRVRRGQGGGLNIDLIADLAKKGLRMVTEGSTYKVLNSAGKVVGKLDSNMTGEQNRQLRGMGEKIPANVDMVKVADEYKGQGVGSALYQAWSNDHEGNIAPHGNTTQAAWDMWKRNFPEQTQQFVKDQAARIQEGTPLSQVMGQVKDPIIANQIRTAAYEPGQPSGLYKKQGGYIKLPFGKSENVEKALAGGPLRDKLNFMGIDRRAPAEVIAAYKDKPDISQNAGKKFFNGLTKGSIYLNDRLQNGVFKYVTDQFKEADNRAKSQINTYIHDMLAPALRKLSDKDMTEAWTAIDKMDKANRRLSDEDLQHLGYSQAAREAIQTHFNVMDEMVPKINAALDDAGLSHIDPRAAYAASKLTGTFRKTLFNADGEVVAALGAVTERDLARQVAAAKAALGGELKEGPMTTMGKSPRAGDLSDILSWLAANDPNMAEFLKNSQDALAPNVRGAKTHFMAKKGVIGMEGRKPWESDYTNAKEGFEAQIKYVQRMLEFAEKAKAEKNAKAVYNSADINQPIAKDMAKKYADFEMGQNTYGAAKAADAIQEFFNTSLGGNIAWMGDVGRGLKKAVNLNLLSLNPGFLAANVMQPLRNLPELAQYVGGDFGMTSFAKVLTQMAADKAGKDTWSPVMKGAIKYAEDNHVYSSDLLDQRSGIRGFGHGEGLLNKIGNSWDATEHLLQTPASKVEATTRKSFFLTMVDVLDKKGITPEKGLYDIAANLTDRGMNRYSSSEAPTLIKGMGPLGGAPYNLMSYKFNELSRLASLMREAKAGNIAPLATSLAMQVSFAGILGTIGYQEADWLVRQFSELAGKPTSLTKILLDNADKKIVGPVSVKDLTYGGLSKATDTDVSNRMGIGAILGSPDPLDMLLPGASKILDIGKVGYELGKSAIKDPTSGATKYNAKALAMQGFPGGAALEQLPFMFPGVTDDKGNLVKTEAGNRIGFNWRKNEAGVERTPADVRAKNFGMTGLSESMKKTGVYENKQIDTITSQHLAGVVDDLAKDYKESGKFSPANLAAFNKWKGDPNTFGDRVTKMAENQHIPMDIRDKLLALNQASTVPGVAKVMRRMH